MKFFFVTIKHKWFVLLAGLKTGAPLWRLIIHDWTKLLPVEYFGYQNHFYGDRSKAQLWKIARRHHMACNNHHPEYYRHLRGRTNQPTRVQITTFEISVAAAREMVADWMGAERAYAGQWPTNTKDGWPWLQGAFWNMDLTLRSRLRIVEVVQAVYPNLDLK